MKNVRDQIIEFEGRKHAAYQDHLGYWTIGVGRLIDERKGGGLSDEEIDFLLANDIRKVTQQIASALPWFGQLNEARQAVLINMAFQMGFDGLMGFKLTLAAIRDEKYDHAANLMLMSKWATQTPNRAKKLSRQMATGEWQ